MKRKIHYVSLISQPDQDLKPKKSERKIQVSLFSAVLVAGMVLSLIVPLRPAVSASEKRDLAKFPEFSARRFLSGDYFDEIDTWFSDTFPFRETLIGINTKLTSWYGFGDKVSSLTDGKGDEIPDAPTHPDDSDIVAADDTTQPAQTSDPSDLPSSEPASENTSESASDSVGSTVQSTSPPVVSTVPATDALSSDTTQTSPKKTETLGGVLVAGRAAYEYYNFVQSTADSYIKAVNRTAKRLDGKATVYDVIIPTSIDITLDEVTRNNVSSSDQKKAIDYFYGSLSDKVKSINIYDTMRSHKGEYIYYRTDHHWTALGAYYAYVDIATAAGKNPVDLSKFEKVSYGEFLGSFYSDTKQNKKLKSNADELIAYKPYYSTTLNYTDSKGNKYNWPIINNVSDYNPAYKYSCFAAGDQPYVRVENNDIEQGPSCVIIKESFGNALIPFIAGNYKKVYVLDYRYWKGDLYSFIEKKNVTEIFFINNISATRNEPLVNDIEKLSKGS